MRYVTRDIDRSSGINHTAVWPHTVPARCSRLYFKTHISVCGISKLEGGGHHICKRTYERQKERDIDLRLRSTIITDKLYSHIHRT